MAATRKYPVELRERAVRLYRESDPKPMIAQLARQLNVHPEALRNWIRQDEADRGERHDRPTTEMLEENRRFRAEVKELRAVNVILGRFGLFGGVSWVFVSWTVSATWMLPMRSARSWPCRWAIWSRS